MQSKRVFAQRGKMNNQQERLDYLLQYMQQEMEEYQSVEIPDEYEDRKKTLRGFMNMRMPKPLPEEIYQEHTWLIPIIE